ncbi:MAG: hypothetical protein ACRDT8_20590 [Micromonosporaceae bacterium]
MAAGTERRVSGQSTVVCAGCDRTGSAETAPLTWSRHVDAPGAQPRWLCDRCTRENLREIEGKLDVW